jgi:hypothetical protein
MKSLLHHCADGDDDNKSDDTLCARRTVLTNKDLLRLVLDFVGKKGEFLFLGGVSQLVSGSVKCVSCYLW